MLSPNIKPFDLKFSFPFAEKNISGMTYILDYISPDEQEQMLYIIDRQTWSDELKRRVQHYGYKYEYKKRAVGSSIYLGTLPNWATEIASRLYQDGIVETPLDQVIVNEYQPGQGIASHLDCISCFAETIVSLSLGSSCVMEFTHGRTKEKVSLLLLPRSLLILQGAARYEWKHRIPPRKTDNYQGTQFVRTRRVSVTFRSVIHIKPS